MPGFCIFGCFKQPPMLKVLLVEDDLTFSRMLSNFLRRQGFTTDPRSTVKDGFAMLEQDSYDLLLLDYRLPDGNGLEVLQEARRRGLDLPAIVMTSFNDVRTAVAAMRFGAFDYITKPVNPDELLMVIQQALKRTKKPAEKQAEAFVRGKSKEAGRLYEHIALVAPTDMSVIIQGESGTGKEHVARAIHDQSKRAGKPFIALDCGALSGDLASSELFGHVKGSFTGALTDKTGQFEAADGGTIFLDEVGNLNYSVQMKLLRAVQERLIQPVGSVRSIPVDVRIIAATNDDLLNSVSEGSFREDLYHRLNEFKILIPALRNRGNDLMLFAEHFIASANRELDRKVESLSPEVTEIFLSYDWPGNLRELKNVIKRMVLLTTGEIAGLEALPEEMMLSLGKPRVTPPGTDIKAINEANERALIASTLAKVKYNKTLAAKLLNIDRKTLYSKIEKYNIE